MLPLLRHRHRHRHRLGRPLPRHGPRRPGRGAGPPHRRRAGLAVPPRTPPRPPASAPRAATTGEGRGPPRRRRAGLAVPPPRAPRRAGRGTAAREQGPPSAARSVLDALAGLDPRGGLPAGGARGRAAGDGDVKRNRLVAALRRGRDVPPRTRRRRPRRRGRGGAARAHRGLARRLGQHPHGSAGLLAGCRGACPRLTGCWKNWGRGWPGEFSCTKGRGAATMWLFVAGPRTRLARKGPGPALRRVLPWPVSADRHLVVCARRPAPSGKHHKTLIWNANLPEARVANVGIGPLASSPGGADLLSGQTPEPTALTARSG